jgi:hypothetical protein
MAQAMSDAGWVEGKYSLKVTAYQPETLSVTLLAVASAGVMSVVQYSVVSKKLFARSDAAGRPVLERATPDVLAR